MVREATAALAIPRKEDTTAAVEVESGGGVVDAILEADRKPPENSDTRPIASGRGFRVSFPTAK